MFTRDSVIISNNIKTPLTLISRAVGDILQLTYGQLVKSLFSNGEQGFAYDPNDLSTMFQDVAGTVPVTAAGQPVGLLLDKSKGLVVGATNFWTGSVTKIDANWANNGDGTFISNGGSGSIGLTSTSMKTGRFYEWTFEVTSRTSGAVRPQNGSGLNYQYVSSVGTHIQKALCSDNSLYFYSNAFNGTIRPISVRELAGNHAYQSTSASRPILRRNAATGAYYLEFDGTDDFLQTANIDFTATDKVSLFAGVVKFATSVRILCELSADMNTNAGSFYLTAPETADGRYGFKSRGSGLSNAAMTTLSSTTSANNAAVISASGNISGDTNIIRRNAVATSSTYELGVGNYGNYPLYIGRRNGTSLPFNGHIYGLIGVGKLASDTVTIALEKELAKRLGVTLSV